MNNDLQEFQDVFFTIIIPTRERSDTLVHTLATALSQDYANFKVLVSDNASQDDTREKVLSIKEPRLRYINTGRRVSMSENWEFAISHVNSGWITVLGDDDAILPGSLSRVNKIIKETNTKAIRSNGCSYSWPGLIGADFGRLSLSLRRGFVVRDSQRMLQDVINGVRHYTELPMLYNGGFISVDLIRKAKEMTGAFFQSMIPDVYSAIVFSFLTKSYVYSHEPLAINGASLHSGGTAGFERVKRTRDYDPAEKFWNEKNIPFHEDIPLLKNGRPVRSIQVIVYESFLQAESFHILKEITTSHSQQLKLAIDKSGPDKKEISDWAILFAKKHKLEIKKTPIFFINKIASSAKLLFARVMHLGQTYTFEGDVRFGLKNVHEASMMAGIIKIIRPSIVGNIFHRIKKKVKDV